MSIKYTKQPVVRMAKTQELTPEIIKHLIEKFQVHRKRYEELDNYYTGNHPILQRTFEDKSKPNNRMVNNFASYIVDVRNGYFTGVPVVYTSYNQVYLEKIKEIFDYNNEPDELSDLDKTSNIKGHAYELVWIDEEGNIRFNNLEPDEVIMIYSADITETPLYAIRYYNEHDPLDDLKFVTRIFAYSADDIKEYEMESSSVGTTITLVGTEPHYFGEVPIIEYINNKERMSSFEDVASLIDAYNVAQSDTVNEIQYFADAYLKLKNMSGTESDDIAKMKENRVLLVEGDGDADFLTKNVNDSYVEHLKERIANDIHKFSKTPNLVSDEFVSNLSGTAIRYKVWGLEQDTAMKERKWRKAIGKRIQLITKILNAKGGNYDPSEIEMTFTRNLPQNVLELGQFVSQLKGSVSTETILKQLPFVDNVTEELARIEQEQQKAIEKEISKVKALQEVQPKELNTNPSQE